MNYMSFFRRVQRLSLIDRCSNTAHIKPYSVAQHSFYLALDGVMFSRIENERLGEEYYDVGIVALKALVHDLEESETGDILFPVHNKNQSFKDKLDYIRNEMIERVVFQEFSELNREFLIHLWKTAKDETPEGQMVACMDKFEILIYVISEFDLGNTVLREVYENAVRIIKEEFKQIKSVIDTVNQIEKQYGSV